jgi:hypothetical protein
MSKRSFKLIKVNNKSPEKSGRYISSSVAGAVKKAFNELLKNSKSKSKSKSVKKTLVLYETTQNSKNNNYKYEAQRVVLKKPKIINKDGNEIIFRYDTKVKRL